MLRHYLIWTWRTLAASPLTTLLNLLALSLGLVSFALASAAALFLHSNDISLPNADRIYAVSEQIFNADGSPVWGALPRTGSPVAHYMKADYPEVEAITYLAVGNWTQTVVHGKHYQLAPIFFDESFFRVLKVPLRYGDPEQAFSRPRAAILTAETALRLFGEGNPVGQPLRVGGLDVSVAGVLAPMAPPSIFRTMTGFSFDLLISRDVSDQLVSSRSEPEAWDYYSGYTMVLMPKGRSPAALRAKLAEFGARHVQGQPHHYKFDLVRLADAGQADLDGFVGTDKTGLSIPTLLFTLGGLVLLVASLNYANLAAAKAIGRLPESGMRKVLGAERGELFAQYLTESLALTIAALALVLLMLVGVAGPFLQATGIDLSRLLFDRPSFWLLLTAGVAVGTLSGGLYPAWLLSGSKAMAAALGGKARSTRSRLASTLVGLQFLAASFLLVMVIIVAQQNGALQRQASALGGSRLLAIDTFFYGEGIGPQDIRNALRGIPGVEAMGESNTLPWSLGPTRYRYFKEAEAKDHAVLGTDFGVSEGYFATMGARLLAGRLFSADRGGDVRPEQALPDEPLNVVVDSDFARSFGWTPDQAIGRSVWHDTAKGGFAPIQIVGVIETQPQVLLANGVAGSVYSLAPRLALLPLVRLAQGTGPETLEAIDRALTRLAPQVEWHRHFGDELFDETSALLTTLVRALSGLALFAVLIALLGLAGMAVHIINGRTEEIGIRKILGADHFVIMRLLGWDLTKPVLIASLIAWPLGYAAGKTYLSLFVGQVVLGPWPFVISFAATIAVAWLAVGWRIAVASAKSPAEILRVH